MGEKRSVDAGERICDVAVVGAGPAGVAAALALAHVGAEVALIGARPAEASAGSRETRTAALLASSVDFLKALKVWPALAPHAAPLEAIRIIDASRSLVRAPDIEFRSSEVGLAAFGYNIANTTLVEALYARAQETVPTLVTSTVTDIAIEPRQALLSFGETTPLACRLVAGADGRRSICRASAGIGAVEHRYDQAAIATSFRHALPHRNVSNELHQEDGSVTTVPLTDALASSLIWVGTPAEITTLMRRDAEGFAEALSERLGGLLGAISGIGARSEFPVAGLIADRLAARRIVLIGEAAHILPPIGAQGLNLGLRDAACLADCVAEALHKGGDPGGEQTLEAYRAARRLDVMSRTLGVDLLGRALLTSLPPLQAVRGIALHGLKAIAPLRRAVMRVGLAPPTELPSLMRRASG
jgi:2-octaprenyl-6-methoxyphenol hydroxylase